MRTLDEFATYAQAMPEYPANDTTDWDNPDYTSFHKKMLPTWNRRLVDSLGFNFYHIFPVEQFAELLKEVTEYRERVYSRGRLVQKMMPEPGSSFIIWGELNGAFHSLVRCLTQLKQQSIIDENLKIIKPLTYFVFNGDVVHRSPYVIETLTLVLLLMKKNPKKVFYLKGDIEDKQGWMEGALGREMRIRASKLSKEKIPFSNLFRRFFGTLPLALYLMPPDQTAKKRKTVRISFFGEDTNELEESDFPYFFDVYSKPVISLLNKVPQETDVSIEVAAYITAEDRSKKFTPSDGLTMLSYNDDQPIWTVLSSPTASFRRLYQFFNDAFVILNVTDDLDSWTLTLYHQNVREPEGFIKDRPFYLVSGKQIEDKQQVQITELQDELVALTKDNEVLKADCVLVQKDEQPVMQEDPKAALVTPPAKISALQNGNLVFGSTMDLSKQLKVYSELLKQGLSLPIDMFNKQGGLGGKKIQIIFLDDEYNGQQAQKNVLKFLQEFKTNVVFSSMGTPVLTGYLDLVKDKKVLGVFPNTGAFHRRDLTYLVHLRTSYLDNGHVIGEYVAQRLEGDRIAFFYQNDAWGKDLLNGAKAEFEKHGKTDFLELPFISNSLDFGKHVEKIKNFEPDAVGLFCNPKTCQRFISEVGADFLHPRMLFGDTVLGQKDFEDFRKEKGLTVVRVQVMPNPHTSNLEIVKEFRKDAKKYDIPIDTVSLEGYMNSKVLIDILRKIEGPLSIESFLETVEGIKDYEFMGLNLNFDPEQRQLLHTVWINTGEDEWQPHDVSWSTMLQEK